MENTATGCHKSLQLACCQKCFSSPPTASKLIHTAEELLRLGVVHRSSNKLFLSAEPLDQIVSGPQYCQRTAPPTKFNIFSSSSEALNTSDSYFDNAM